MDNGQTIVIPGPYGPGHTDYEIGYRHGASGKPAVRPHDDTYMNGWADGYCTQRQKESEATDACP